MQETQHRTLQRHLGSFPIRLSLRPHHRLTVEHDRLAILILRVANHQPSPNRTLEHHRKHHLVGCSLLNTVNSADKVPTLEIQRLDMRRAEGPTLYGGDYKAEDPCLRELGESGHVPTDKRCEKFPRIAVRKETFAYAGRRMVVDGVVCLGEDWWWDRGDCLRDGAGESPVMGVVLHALMERSMEEVEVGCCCGGCGEKK